MNKQINNLTDDELYILIGKNVAKYRKKANMSQLELSLEMGHNSTSLVSSAELYRKSVNLTLLNLKQLLKYLILIFVIFLNL